MKTKLPAINVQYPISQMILDGTKTVETRTYDMPEHYLGRPMFLVETPGKRGKFKARIVAVVEFESSFQYPNKSTFYSDKRHRVTKGSEWAWSEKPKWGWLIKKIKILPEPVLAPAGRGIAFTKSLSISLPAEFKLP